MFLQKSIIEKQKQNCNFILTITHAIIWFMLFVQLMNVDLALSPDYKITNIPTITKEIIVKNFGI